MRALKIAAAAQSALLLALLMGSGSPLPTARAQIGSSGMLHTLTLADDGSTITIPAGDSVALKLGSDYIWSNVAASDTTVLRRPPVALTRDTQGLWNAASPGRATVTATGAPNCAPDMVCIQIVRLFSATVIVTPTAESGPTITYPAGWNLIGVPGGTTIPGPLGPIYTFQAGDTAYKMVQNLQPGTGYWIYFSTPASVTLPFTGPLQMTKQLPAGQYIMVGNPGNAAAILSGADAAYLYDPVSGYQPTDQIPPGEGAWVISNAGGTLAIRSGIR